MNKTKEKSRRLTNAIGVRFMVFVAFAMACAFFLAACENNMETEDLATVVSVESHSRRTMDGNPNRTRGRNFSREDFSRWAEERGLSKEDLSREDFYRWAEERGLSKEDFSRRRDRHENHRTGEWSRRTGEHPHRRFFRDGERERRRG